MYTINTGDFPQKVSRADVDLGLGLTNRLPLNTYSDAAAE